MFSLLPLRILYFPCYVQVSLDFKLERIKKIPKIFQSILCRMDKLDLFLNKNVLLFDVLTILIHHFVLFFSISSQKNKFYVKKEKQFSVKLHDFFFVFYVGWTYILRASLLIKESQ